MGKVLTDSWNPRYGDYLTNPTAKQEIIGVILGGLTSYPYRVFHVEYVSSLGYRNGYLVCYMTGEYIIYIFGYR